MNRYLQYLGAFLSSAGLAVASGCKHNCGHECNVDAPNAMPHPLGTFSCQWQHAQMERAELDDFVFHSYEWQVSGTALNQYGQDHLEAMADRILQSPYPVIIARSDNERLDEGRREALVVALVARGIEDAGERVMIARPKAEGLSGVDIPTVSAGYASPGQAGQNADRGGRAGGFGGGFFSSGYGF